MTQKNLCDIVREMEVVEFPEFSRYDSHITESEYTGIPNFSPSHHISRGLVNEEVIRDLRENRKLALTLGCGCAYLERLLVKRFGISPERIELVNENAQEIPEGFRAYFFDITKEWPFLNRTYDYVFIPESFTCLEPYERDVIGGDSQQIRVCYDLLVSSLSVLNVKGQIRGDGHCFVPKELEALENKMRGCPVRNLIKYDKKLLVVEKSSPSS